MDWLKEIIKKNPLFSLLLPTSIGGLSFFGNLFNALSDGKIDSNEFHQLMSSADVVQMILLLIIMIALKKKVGKK
jgi:hypothetical protein